MRNKYLLRVSTLMVVTLLACFALPAFSQARRAMTFEDVMRFRAIHDPVVSEDGRWIAYAAEPDRGDGELSVHSTEGQELYTLERGSKPVFSKDSRWVAAAVKPLFVEVEMARSNKGKQTEPRAAMALLDTQTGQWKRYDRVERFALSDDSRWIAMLHHHQERKEAGGGAGKAQNEAGSEKSEKTGSTLTVVSLPSGLTSGLPHVTSFAFSPDSRYLVYAAMKPEGKGNGVFSHDLTRERPEDSTITEAEGGRYASLTWAEETASLAFLAAPQSDLEDSAAAATLNLWHGRLGQLKTAHLDLAENWIVPLKNEVRWTKDGKRIFFGQKPAPAERETADDPAGSTSAKDIYSIEDILKQREGDVWHWNDPRIVTHQKQLWPREKDRTYRMVYHLDSDRAVALADLSLPEVAVSENPNRVLGTTDLPYRKEITWSGNFFDLYTVELSDGSRRKVASRLSSRPSLSPAGRFVTYFMSGDWHLYDCASSKIRNLTAALGVPFADEDHDTPDEPSGYGVAGWTDNDEAVLINDKFDIWQFSTATGAAASLTGGDGRRRSLVFRLRSTDPEKESWSEGEPALLSSYSDREKNHGFYASRIGQAGVSRLLEEEKKFSFLSKSRNADVLLYTRESYSEFPDLWVTDSRFKETRKLTQVNPQMAEFAWGESELVEWHSLDGTPLQGVLLKPGDYEPGKRYPVLVYYYELSAQRMYEFNQPVVNHRPCFPLYTSNGYALFLPDVRYEVGRPGLSATKCLVPGVQKLIDMGIADPKGVGLHGHSWSGYQTAFVITQTNIFAAAIAGAPVSNMTSAYSGIRWESGLARQFQYEKGQSRIGRTLWEAPQSYIENSPVFFADRIQTPLLIQFGDEDGAVPWYQGIELYLAMRRLGKDCIFLQYHGEPHHLQKYPNKVDYAIKMKEYLDHYLKGQPAAEWIREGVPYQGR